MTSLETVNITGCLGLEKLPEHLGNMQGLTDLLANETAVQQLPSSIGNLKKHKKLLLCGFGYVPESTMYSEENFFEQDPGLYPQDIVVPQSAMCSEEIFFKQGSARFPEEIDVPESAMCLEEIEVPESAMYSEENVIKQQTFLPLSFSGLSSLTTLHISNRHLSNSNTSINLGNLSSLQDLKLASNDISELPAGSGHLPKLEKLDLSACRNLLFISEIPSNLRTLVARDCISLEKVSIQSKTAPDLLLSRCGKLAEIQGMESVENKPVIRMENCNNLSNNFKEILLQVLSKGKLPDIVLPGSDVRHWFIQYQRDRSSSTFRIPAISVGLIQGLIVWTVYADTGKDKLFSFSSLCSASIRKKNDNTELFYTRPYFGISSEDEDHSWVIYIPFSRIQGTIEGGDELEVSVKPGNAWYYCKEVWRASNFLSKPDAMDI